MPASETRPLRRAADVLIRMGTGALAVAMGVVLVRFLSQSDSLWRFTMPMAMVFTLFGWGRPTLGLYPLIFFLPLVPLVPHVHGVWNFSLIELGWWSLLIGRLARRTAWPRALRTPPPPSWPLLTLLTVVICGSATVRLLRNAVWTDPMIYDHLWAALGDFFRMPQESPFHSLRAMAVWLEGVAFLALVRRNAPRRGFQMRVRFLLMISLTFVILVSLHQFALSMRLGDDAPQALADWQLQPDWLPGWIIDLWPTAHAIHGPWPDVNSFASYLLMMFPLLLSTFVLSRNVFGRALLMLLGGATALVIVLTFSRIAWLWFPVMLTAWALLSRRRSRRLWGWAEERGRPVILIGLLAALACLGLLAGTQGGVRFADRAVDSRLGDHVNVTMKGRLNLWEKALRAAHSDVFFGCGYGSFFDRSAYHHDQDAGVTAWGQEVWNPERENAHNQFLQIFAETGLIGLALALLLMTQWAAMALRVAAWGRGGDRWTARGLLAGIVALTGTLMTGHALLLCEMLFQLWVFVGLAFVVPRGPRLPTPPRAPPPWSGRAEVALVILVLISGVRVWQARGGPDLLHYGSGLHPPESEVILHPETGDVLVNRPFRWTTDEVHLMLRNINGECSFQLSHALPGQDHVDVEVWIDGEFRGRVRPPDFHWWPNRFAVDLPPNAPYRLELRVLNPQRLGDRVLGVRMRRLSY